MSEELTIYLSPAEYDTLIKLAGDQPIEEYIVSKIESYLAKFELDEIEEEVACEVTWEETVAIYNQSIKDLIDLNSEKFITKDNLMQVINAYNGGANYFAVEFPKVFKSRFQEVDGDIQLVYYY